MRYRHTEAVVKQLDPLGSTRRTHYCGMLRPEHVGQQVSLCGWVHRRRDHGGVVFIDLRDRSGVAQVVFKPDTAPGAHDKAGRLRPEFVMVASGRLEPRDDEAINQNLPTGEVELIASDLRILNTATTPPFPIEDDAAVDEALRLRHRVHDLRRPLMQSRLKTRHHLLQSVRAACSDLGLYEIETPILNRSTPEGARDFLVPSRVYPGSFYALPQSPQIIKQLLMVAGFDGYFQIARCFRDEDQRADRQLEFAQIDIEMSFVGVDDVLRALEELTARAFRDVCGVELPRPFPRRGFSDVQARYGTDRPDTRFGLELVDLSDILVNSDFNVFAQAVRKGGVVKGAAAAERRGRVAQRAGPADRACAGLRGPRAWRGYGLPPTAPGQSPIAKYLDDAEQQQISERAGLRAGHLLLFIAGQASDRQRRSQSLAPGTRQTLGTRRWSGLGCTLRRGFSFVRRDRKRSVDIHAHALRRTAGGRHQRARQRSTEGKGHALRPRDQRNRDGIRQPAQPPKRRATQNPGTPGLQGSRGPRAFRFPPRRPRLRSAAARGIRFRL